MYDEKIFRLLLDYEVRRSLRYVNPLAFLRVALALRNPSPHEMENAPSALAFLLNTRLRATDVSGRFGNEFAVFMPNTNETGARAVCERLITITAGKHYTPDGRFTRLHICIGMTSQPGGPSLNVENLMREAEAALQESRARGPQTYAVFSGREPHR